MKYSEVLAKLLSLAQRFNALGTTSMADLLSETGYCEVHDRISENAIFIALSENPFFIKDWLVYSEDKRTKSGWYIKQNENGAYLVGNLDDQQGGITEWIYSDQIKACAAFVKCEVEAIRMRVLNCCSPQSSVTRSR